MLCLSYQDIPYCSRANKKCFEGLKVSYPLKLSPRAKLMTGKPKILLEKFDTSNEKSSEVGGKIPY